MYTHQIEQDCKEKFAMQVVSELSNIFLVRELVGKDPRCENPRLGIANPTIGITARFYRFREKNDTLGLTNDP
jgi:hypothetical protein